MDEKTEVPRGKVVCPGLLNQFVAELVQELFPLILVSVYRMKEQYRNPFKK